MYVEKINSHSCQAVLVAKRIDINEQSCSGGGEKVEKVAAKYSSVAKIPAGQNHEAALTFYV